MRNILFCLFLLISGLITGQKQIQTTDLWQDYTFYTKSVPGFNFLNDGRHYTRLQDNVIKKYDLITGDFVADLLVGDSLSENAGFSGNIQSYVFSGDEKHIMIQSESERIYRRSSKGKFHLYHFETGQLTNIWDGEGKISYATLSPDGKKVAFVHENNLYYKNLETNMTTQITTDGSYNQIINGSADWVYEEEFSFAKAFFWSPKGNRLAFIRFDESEVSEFTMTMYYDELYPEYRTFKYPKVGEANAKVSAHIYDLTSKTLIKAAIGDETDIYIPRIKWTSKDDQLLVYKMNRHQNDLKLLQVNAVDGTSSSLLHETNKYYIDITDDFTFFDDGKKFIWTSEKEGYHQIYVYNSDGTQDAKLTKGAYDVTAFYGVDDQNNKVYYQAADTNPMERYLFELDLKTGKTKKILNQKGSHRAQFSNTFDYFVDTYSTINTAPTYTVYDRSGKVIRVIEDNAKIKSLQEAYGTQPVEFFSFNTSENVNLNGWMIKPSDFDPNKQYPVFMTQYSGPGSQQVTDAWKGNNYWWYQQLAQNGYIVACVDPRGTGGRGEEFKKMTYLQLGKYETIDQIEAAKYLAGQPYVDGSRMGIYGWSYGGYMSSLAILKGNDVFKAAIAVAPVTSWKWYDTVYTERYMRTLAENPDGYNDNSPIYFADQLKGHYLLVHGVGDDNVHFQHTAEMANALIKANKQFDTYFYPNRNHGIYGDNARIHLWNKMNAFIFENL